MKTVSTALAALLATGDYVAADLWTITLSGGLQVFWTGHDKPISYGGNAFAQGPMIDRDTITEKVGVEVATLGMTITALAADLINGTPIIPFIAQHGLDGASIKLERAYAPDWATPITGSVIRFAGKVTSVDAIQGASAHVTVSSWLVLLNPAAPRNLYQAGCMRTLYDAGCGIDPNAHKATGTITTGGTQTFLTSVSGAADVYSQGRIVFTSGPNAGISRTVKTNDGTGNVSLVTNLPVACAAGNAFTIYAGCDLTQTTCNTKFSNLGRYKATPFVPLPTTALGAPSTTTTTGGKG